MGTALIVGAGGQDGRLLAQLLGARGYTVIGWVRRKQAEVLQFQTAVVDLVDQTAVRRALEDVQPAEIYYLAAYHHASEDAVNEKTTDLLARSFDVHVVGLLNVLHAIKQCCQLARLFYAASAHVFGNPGQEWADETTPFRPESAYGISKLAGMRCCELVRKQEKIFSSTGILFHHDSAFRKASFVSQRIVQGALRARRDPAAKVSIGNLNAQIDWGYAPDYVDAMVRILQLPEPEDFVISSGELHSVGEFVEAAFDAVALDWRDHVQADPHLVRRNSQPLRGNSAKLRTATGWAPTLPFKEFVGHLVKETEKLNANA